MMSFYEELPFRIGVTMQQIHALSYLLTIQEIVQKINKNTTWNASYYVKERHINKNLEAHI